MRYIVAKGGYCTVIIGAAPFPKHIWKAIDVNLCSNLLSIGKQHILPGLLALAVRILQGCLNRGRIHNGAGISISAKSLYQGSGKAKIPFHKFFRMLRAVYSRQIKYKITVCAILFQHFLRGINIIGQHFHIFTLFQFCNQILTNKSFGSCNQDLHYRFSHFASSSRI